MKTLELKHVAPYLAYELEWEVVSRGNFTTSPDEVKIEQMTTANISLFLAKKVYKRLSCKPILRPLSQLPQDEKTCAEINLLLEPNGLEINNFLLLKNSILNVAISWQEMQEVLNILYREHYDVFGLIEQNLAIEKP